MTETVRQQLKRWGLARQAFLSVLEDGDRGRVHALAEVRSMAPGTRERAERELVGRDGFARRGRMAKAAGNVGYGLIPMWACDPVPARNDASPPKDVRAVIEPATPDDLRWIDRALAQMARRWPLRERIVREEFTGGGTQAARAKRIEEQYGGSLTVWQYRAELTRGLDWLETWSDA